MSDDVVRDKVRLYAGDVTPAQLPSFSGVAVRRRRRRWRQLLAAASTVVVVVLVVLFAALVTSGSPARPAGPSGSLASQLVGPTWTLSTITDQGVVWQVPTDTRWSLTFTEAGYAGNDGCNSVSGTVSYRPDKVALAPGRSTLVGCSGDADSLRLQHALDMLQGRAVSATVGGGTLTLTVGSEVLSLTSGDEASAVPTAATSLRDRLIGPTWRLQSVASAGVSWHAIASSVATLTMTGSSFEAQDGCASHSSGLSVDPSGRTITFDVGVSKTVECLRSPGPPAGSTPPMDYVNALDGTFQVSLSGGTLMLTSGGTVLAFNQVADGRPSAAPTVTPLATIDGHALQAGLEGVNWALRSVSKVGQVTQVAPVQKARLYLISGHYYFDDGCGILFGTIMYDTTHVTFKDQGQIGTAANCDDTQPAFAVPSQALIDVGRGHPVFRFSSTGLTLASGDEVLTFDRVPVIVGTSSPVEHELVGHVWQLTSYVLQGKSGSIAAAPTSTLELTDTQFRAFDGCTWTMGYVSFSKGTVSPRVIGQTDPACGPSSVDAAKALTALLRGGPLVASVNGSTLTLTGAGVILVFTLGPTSAGGDFFSLPPLPPF